MKFILILSSRLCIGTGRLPLSRRSSADHALVEVSPSLSNRDECRDTRLGLLASLFDATERGAGLRMGSATDDVAAATWNDQIEEVFETMVRLRRLTAPLSCKCKPSTY